MIHLDEKLDSSGQEKAVLVGIYNRNISKDKAKEYLDEMQLLTQTAGAKTLKTYLQRMDKVNSGTYIGKGKLEEIKQFIEENGVDLVVFDDDLTPSQVRNIDRILDVKVLDRSAVILDIFSTRARSSQARAQVELAHLQYMLPRLTGLWTHLSKQKGGIGMKGAGETEIETDRRQIREKIDLLRKELKKIDRQNQTRRKRRGEVVRVSLVGYTNAGKSTLMNRLSKSEVLAEDKLFATLDTTVRKVVLERVPFLLSDTVGFLRKLPHHLVECFKSTLDEVRESDILLHVVDLSHPTFEEQIEVVNETLVNIGAGDKPTVVVFNKIDNLEKEQREKLEATWWARENSPAVFVSAGANLNIPALRSKMLELIRQQYKDKYPHFKYAQAPDYEALAQQQNETGEWNG